METLKGMVNMARYGQRKLRISLKDLSIQEVINALKSVAQTADKVASFNTDDAIEGNVRKLMEIFIPDSMDDANIMRHKAMEVFNRCSSDMKSNLSYQWHLWLQSIQASG